MKKDVKGIYTDLITLCDIFNSLEFKASVAGQVNHASICLDRARNQMWSLLNELKKETE